MQIQWRPLYSTFTSQKTAELWMHSTFKWLVLVFYHGSWIRQGEIRNNIPFPGCDTFSSSKSTFFRGSLSWGIFFCTSSPFKFHQWRDDRPSGLGGTTVSHLSFTVQWKWLWKCLRLASLLTLPRTERRSPSSTNHAYPSVYNTHIHLTIQRKSMAISEKWSKKLCSKEKNIPELTWAWEPSLFLRTLHLLIKFTPMGDE